MPRIYKVITVLVAATALLTWLFSARPAQRELPELAPVPIASGGGTLVVDLVDGATEADRDRVAERLGAPLRWAHPLAVDEALTLAEVPDFTRAIARLRGHTLVEVAEPQMAIGTVPEPTEIDVESLRVGTSFPNDPLYPKQWNLHQIGVEAAYRYTPRGHGVIVAVLDTGVSRVEDLKQTNVLQGFSTVPGEPDTADHQGHGTHVAGTIAQATHNGIGVAGIAPRASILPVKVLSRRGMGQSSWIAAGIDHAVDEGAGVINLSLGSPSRSQVIEIAINKARERGVLVVAATGNSGQHGVHYPGALASTIGVAAVGPDARRAPYSSFGPGVDLAAPGGDLRVEGGGVLQDTIGPGGRGHRYAAFQGTSMATPHVSGAAAVLLSMGLTPDQVEQRLLSSASGGEWEPELGMGRLDLAAAIGGIVPQGSPLRALIGLVLGLLIGRLAHASLRWVAVGAVVAAITAGGLFVLAWLPVSLPAVLSVGLLHWPTGVAPGWITTSPLWLSALVPVAVALFGGAFRVTRAPSMGLALGVAAHLGYGAITGELQVAWLGSDWGAGWLMINATVCVAVAMALAGAEKIEREAT